MFRQQRSICMRILLILSFMVVVVSLAGCSGNSSTKDVPIKSTVKDDRKTTGSMEPSPSSVSMDPKDSGLPPVGVGFAKFMEVKGKAYELMDLMTDQITGSGDTMASLALLPLLTADLSILPLAMTIAFPSIGDNVWDGEFRVMTDGKGRAELKGEICTFSMELAASDDSQNIMIVTGEYDTKKDSLRATFTTGGKETVSFEYAASGKGYVSQLFYLQDDGITTSLIKNAFDEKILYAGMTLEKAKPDSIYQKNVEIGEGFVQSEEIMVVLEKGKGHALIDGKKYKY
jgi:hypothetical protein